MLQFSCPHCDAELEAGKGEAGTKISCPDCGKRFLVPSPKPSKKSAEVTTKRPTAKAPARGAAPKPKRRARDEDDDEEDEEESGSSKTLWIVLGVGGGVAAIALVAVLFLVMGKKDKPADAVAGNTTPATTSGAGVQPNRPVGPSIGPAEQVKPAEEVKPAEPIKPAEAPPMPIVRGGAADGKKIYQHLLKSTTLIIHPVRSPSGQIGLSMGSGSLVDKTNRLILTNYHVVGQSDKVFVFFPTYKDGKLIAEQDYFFRNANEKDALVGKVVMKDQRIDLAIVQLEKLPDSAQPLAFAADRPSPATPVYSVGHPGRSGGLWVYTEGKVRQVLHKVWQASGGPGTEVLHCDADVVLTDSPTNQGDSGGPLVNGRGELVAVVHGSDPSSNLMSLFIDLVEVKGILNQYAKTSGTQLSLATGSPLGTEVDTQNLPDLMLALDSKDSGTRANAARALGELGPSGKLAVQALLKAVSDKDDVVRRLALEALGKIGAPAKVDAPLLANALKDANQDVRLYAAATLGKMGAEGRAAVPALIEALKDTNSALRQSAARSLGLAGADNKAVVQPALVEALKDADAEVRGAAAEGLASLPLSGADVAAMKELLKHADAEVRAQAARALGKIGPDARVAMKPLTEATQDKNARVRQYSLEALGRFGIDAKEAIPEMEKALKDSDKETRRAAILALAGMGAEAKSAAKGLADAVQDFDLRKSAIAALVKIGPSVSREGAPAIAGILSAPDKEDRLLALDALATLKPGMVEAREVVPKVVDLLEDKDKEIRDKATQTLAKFGKVAVAGLRNALSNPNRLVRLAAATALGDIGPDAKDARVVVQAHAQADDDPFVRQACVRALSKFQR